MKKILSLLTLMMLCMSGAQAQKTWDFTQDLSATDVTNLNADALSIDVSLNSDNRDGYYQQAQEASKHWILQTNNNRYSITGSYAAWSELKANDATIERTAGLLFARNDGNIGNDQIRLDPNRVMLNGTNIQVRIPSCKAGDVITIVFASGNATSERGLTADNATLAEGSVDKSPGSATQVESQWTVTADGDVTFKQDSGLNWYSITWTSSGESGSDLGTPAITFTAGAEERQIVVGNNGASPIYIDWGNGNPVSDGIESYDGLSFWGTPSGQVKIYGSGITYFEAPGKFNEDKTDKPNAITAIDLTNATDLAELYINTNKLTTIDLSKNTKLTTIELSNNELTAIDLTALTNLASLTATDNKLTAIDLSANAAITKVVLSNNQLQTLDLSNNPLAKTVTVMNNQLTSVNIGANTASKQTFQFGGNKLTSFSLMEATDISGAYVRLRDNELTELLLPGQVKQIWADGNAFTLSQLYQLKGMTTGTFTYATLYTKEYAQQPMAITADGATVDLSSEAVLGEAATTFVWKTAEGATLTEGTDYTVAGGVFTFLTEQTDIHCEMTNAELPLFTTEKPFLTTTATTPVIPPVPTVVENVKGLKDYLASGSAEGYFTLNLTNAKITYVGTKDTPSVDDDGNDITVATDVVVIEDATGATMLQGTGLGNKVKKGDAVDADIVLSTVEDFFGIVTVVATENTAASLETLRITAGTAQPTEITEANVNEWMNDFEWRYVKFNDVTISVVDGDYSKEYSAYIDVLEDNVSLSTMYLKAVPQDQFPANGQKRNIEGYYVTYMGMMTWFEVTKFETPATGISQAKADTDAESVYYNLRGMRVAAPQKPGLYIKDGKKVMVK